jgi:hypothetical protein
MISVAVALSLGLGSASASSHTTAQKRSHPEVFLTNDPQIAWYNENGLGQQLSTSLAGNGMNTTRVNEGTACGGLTVYSFHNNSGYWVRVPAGATTVNLSTIHDARAEFIGHPAASSGMTYGFFGNGCSGDGALISIPNNLIRQGIVIANPGNWTNWMAR